MQIQRSVRTLVSVLSLAIMTLLGSSAALAAKAKQVATPPAPQQAPFTFSSTPTDDEFLRVGLFAEPLAPVIHGDTEDNRDLAKALMAYKSEVEQSGAPDAVTPLVRYLDSHPHSSWRASLQLNLGMIYRQTGHFSKALAVWQDGWEEAKASNDPHGKSIANAIVARLSQLEAYLGRKELLSPLLDSLKDRPIGGTATQLITNSKEGLYDMTFKPEDSFRCGPLALKRILNHGSQQPSALALKVLDLESPSTDHGLSLTNVRDIAERAGMHYQAAFRSPGAAVIYPAVAHWNVGHYAALVEQQQDGRYLVQDTTFGEDIRISEATLNEESSGYFLVPKGALPEGWRPVSEQEGAEVWGRGDTGNRHDDDDSGGGCPDCDTQGTGDNTDDGTTGDGSNDGSVGYTRSKVELQVVGLQLRDMPVGYQPPVGPDVRFKLFYSHRDMQQQLTSLNYTNFGSRWTFIWLSYVTDTVNSAKHAQLYLRGGGSEPYTFANATDTTAFVGPYSQTVLTRTLDGGGNSAGFIVTHPDGSSEVYGQASGNLFFMTAVKDAAGNTVTLSYDLATMRITGITDAVGQITTLTYDTSPNTRRVTRITDPFGRSASFTYDGSGHLASITDVLGLTSSYLYGQGTDTDFINTLTTPYGTSTFVFGDVGTNPALGSTRFLKSTDPMGRITYVEFDNGVEPGDSVNGYLKNSNLLPTGMSASNGGYLHWRNTFVWDPNQYQLATANGGLDYSLAKVVHWLHSSDISNTSRVRESVKEPLENRVWYNYPGQSSNITFPVDSGKTIQVNGASSKPSIIGRVLDDGSTQLYQYQYNIKGNITQYIDPVGRTWSYTYDSNGIDRLITYNITNSRSDLLETRTYNSLHEPLTIKGANGKTSHYQYNTVGLITKYTDQLGNINTLTYDSLQRLKSVRRPIALANYAFTYDGANRMASATDPSGYTTSYAYDAADRQTKITYPDGTKAISTYSLLDLTKSTDRLSQTTQYQYDADRELIKTTDPSGNITRRAYSTTGKLNSLTDPNNHTTTWSFDAQSRVIAKQFANSTTTTYDYKSALSLLAQTTDALNQTTVYTYSIDDMTSSIAYASQQRTPSVSFVYDAAYPRPISMTDGTGTTSYAYYPVNAAVNANQLRSVSSPVAGGALNDTITYSYDALNRAVITSVNGVARTAGYDALGRQLSASNALDTFTYAYGDGTNRVTTVSSTAGPTTSLAYFGPAGDELLQQIAYTAHTGGASLAQFTYTYDANDNVRTQGVTSPVAQTTNYGYDPASRLTSALIGTGTPQYQYTYDHASNLTSITANGPAQSYSYTNTNAISGSSYDGNGSPTSLAGKVYKWDGANRVVTATNASASTSSSFTYDGFSRLVRIVDTHAGTITGDHSYTWCGQMRCLARDNLQTNSPVSTQYFDQGVIVGATKYYSLSDRLGSVTQLITVGGSIASQYTYDPYGNRATVSETVNGDTGYASYFYHAVSGLNLTQHRAYDATRARWLNRDPIAENGGINLYTYVAGNPLNNIDPRGLDIMVITGGVRDNSLNYAGHVGSAVEGYGMSSYGNQTPLGSGTLDYLISQSQFRNQQVTIIPTTPDQDLLAQSFINAHPDDDITLINNCAVRTNQILNAAGIDVEGNMFPGGVARDVASLPGATTYFIPQNGPIPQQLLDVLYRYGHHHR